MGKYDPQTKARDIVNKVATILDSSGVYPNAELRINAIMNICLLYINELRNATYGGYDYDAEFELPYYDAIEMEILKILEENLNNIKK